MVFLPYVRVAVNLFPPSRIALRISCVVSKADRFIKAYRDFRESVDLSKGGILPDLDNLAWYVLMGVPHVPADDDSSDTAPMEAIDQRIIILKALFVEANSDESDDFLDQGLRRYDLAAKMAKAMLDGTVNKDGTESIKS